MKKIISFIRYSWNPDEFLAFIIGLCAGVFVSICIFLCCDTAHATELPDELNTSAVSVSGESPDSSYSSEPVESETPVEVPQDGAESLQGSEIVPAGETVEGQEDVVAEGEEDVVAEGEETAGSLDVSALADIDSKLHDILVILDPTYDKEPSTVTPYIPSDPSGMKAVVIDVFGEYEPIYDTETGNIVSGVSGVNWSYVLMLFFISVTIWCLFKIVGVILC